MPSVCPLGLGVWSNCSLDSEALWLKSCLFVGKFRSVIFEISRYCLITNILNSMSHCYKSKKHCKPKSKCVRAIWLFLHSSLYYFWCFLQTHTTSVLRIVQCDFQIAFFFSFCFLFPDVIVGATSPCRCTDC